MAVVADRDILQGRHKTQAGGVHLLLDVILTFLFVEIPDFGSLITAAAHNPRIQ